MTAAQEEANKRAMATDKALHDLNNWVPQVTASLQHIDEKVDAKYKECMEEVSKLRKLIDGEGSVRSVGTASAASTAASAGSSSRDKGDPLRLHIGGFPYKMLRTALAAHAELMKDSLGADARNVTVIAHNLSMSYSLAFQDQTVCSNFYTLWSGQEIKWLDRTTNMSHVLRMRRDQPAHIREKKRQLSPLWEPTLACSVAGGRFAGGKLGVNPHLGLFEVKNTTSGKEVVPHRANLDWFGISPEQTNGLMQNIH
ncbi:unnamed protein product [Prorocentrum cordatum]|uniref:Uncharacterized protein n=1 Tax=Prorocentrum cordatum TaxID=2364126 RepID=A0ABN9TY87_9DINO|nr:unnamed protein product [Polarella glacialis]